MCAHAACAAVCHLCLAPCRQPITLASWTLTLCSAPVTAAQGPTGTGGETADGTGVVFVQYAPGREAAQSQTVESSAGVTQYETAPLATSDVAQPAYAAATTQPQTAAADANVASSQADADVTQSQAAPAADFTPSQTGAATVTQPQAAAAVTQPQATSDDTSAGPVARSPGPLPGLPPPRQPQDMPAMPRVSLSISDRGVSLNLTRLNSTSAGSNETQPAIRVQFGRR
jgi:hypothetical protein